MENPKSNLFFYLMATDSYDVRRYLAILFSAGGSMSMTLLLGWCIALLSAHAGFIFWISIGLLILIGLMQTGLISLLVKRSVLLSKDKIELVDNEVVSKVTETQKT